LKKILVIRFSSIGDIVLISPVLRCLGKQLPDAEIHVLTRKPNRNLFLRNPYVKKVFFYDQKLEEVVDDLQSEQYDHIVDLHKNFRSFNIRRKLGKPVTSFPKLNIQKYLLVQFKIRKMPDIHIVDRYFEAVKILGVVNDQKGLDYFPTSENLSFPADFSFLKGYYAIVIGGKHATKILPDEKVVDICMLLNLPVVLLGGKEDAERGSFIFNELKTNVYNACGRSSLDESAHFLQNAAAVLTNDTGLMHIAAALHKPIVSVWGNTVPELGMYPYLPDENEKSIIIENREVSCRPCSKIGFEKCPKDHFNCMKSLSDNEIANSLILLRQKFAYGND
jgi:ADP-heptose:LPS heptosyltransferase